MKVHCQPAKAREMGRKLYFLPIDPLIILRSGAHNLRGKPEASASFNYS